MRDQRSRPEPHPPSHLRPILQALLVTFLWSTSWVLIKVGLEQERLPALTFAGLRYGLAFLILGAWVAARPRTRMLLWSLDRRAWGLLAALGVVMYALTQGAQFLALDLLPATTVSLVLSFTPAIVAVTGALFLGEPTSVARWIGILTMLVGAALFLWPIPAFVLAGLPVAVLGLASNSGASLLGRVVNRAERLPAAVVTVVSMGIGSVLLAATGLAVETPPAISLRGWMIIVWLAVVNTAFAFTLWNHTLRRLTATESSVINNTMLIQIAVLAWMFLGERLGARHIAGLVLAATGAVVVQSRRTGGYAVGRARGSLRERP